MPDEPAQKPDNGGVQNAVNGKCPKGFVHVFGPLCVEQTTLAKIEDAVPDLPEFDFTNPGCEAALAALKEVTDMVEQAIEMPKKLMKMADELIEKPFDAAQDIVDNALGVIDAVSAMIDEFLAGPAGLINELKQSIESMLACPFIADTPIAKTAAALLDAMDEGADYHDLLSSFKNMLSSAAKEQINKVKDVPLSALGDIEKLYNDMIERSGVGELIKKAQDLEQCVRAACNLLEVAARVPTAAADFIEQLGGKFNETTGKFTATLVRPVTESAKRAKQLADDLAVIKLAGKG